MPKESVKLELTVAGFEKIAEKMRPRDPRFLPRGTGCRQITKPLLTQLSYGGDDRNHTKGK